MNFNEELNKNVVDAEGLASYLDLSGNDRERMDKILDSFPMTVTPYYLSLIDFTDADDPIRKMSIPSIAETDLSGSFDTSGEAHNTVMPGLQHKYKQTALMLSTSRCAMYCRHCFRKRFVGLSDEEIASNFENMRAYITEHREITNVLVSGGDALVNSNSRLEQILDMLCGIEHIDAVRICTRIPVVWPQRITQDQTLLDMLNRFSRKKQLVFATQFNHPNEFTDQSIQALREIRALGIPIINQTVLLKGVNDIPQTLGTLLRLLVSNGVMPYYVFQCRPVSGVKNQFQVPLRRAYKVVEEAKTMQNGIGKTFRYCMSHITGKIEILGIANAEEMYFKYHEAANEKDLGRVFKMKISEDQTWLSDSKIF